MDKARLTVVALILAGTSPALSQAPHPQQHGEGAGLSAVLPKVEQIFRRYQQEAHVPGLVYGIVQNGGLVHLGRSGVQDLKAKRPVGPDTLFRIASMSKAFTALAILKLRDEGKLSLDDLAEKHVPEMRGWRYPTSDSPRIRVRDLLNHTGGLVTDDPWGDRQQPLSETDFTRMLQTGVPFQRTPGTAFEYSNFGYAVLGRIVTNASGRPYKDYIEQGIMRPLAMTSTGYEVQDWPLERRAIGYRWENDAWSEEPTMAHGTFGAMGGVQTSANDYAKWISFLLSAWPARDGGEEGPARRATVREMAQGSNFASARPLPGKGSGDGCPIALAYGMGFNAGQHCDLGQLMFHGGGYPGYGSFLLLLPDHNTGIFALANRTYAGPTPPVFAVAEELHRAGLLKGRQWPVSQSLAAAYAAAKGMHRAGSVEPGRRLLAMNFLMDRSAENWAKEFARLREQTGTCQTEAPVTATGALAGRFTWNCERARLEGNLLLAPTEPAGIQALRFNVVPNPRQ